LYSSSDGEKGKGREGVLSLYRETVEKGPKGGGKRGGTPSLKALIHLPMKQRIKGGGGGKKGRERGEVRSYLLLTMLFVGKKKGEKKRSQK